MALQCNATDIHMTAVVPGLPVAGQPISVTTWMSGIWSTTAAKSFVGVYGPAASPTTAIQVGSRTTAGTCTVWTWGGGAMVTSPAVMVDNQMHFIAYTYDGATHRLYVDGALVATSTVALIAGQYEMFYINGYPTGLTNETSTHIVNSVRLYNRALSADEIVTFYNSRGARHSIVNGLLSYYEFDEAAQGANVGSVTCLAGNTALSSAGAGTAMTYTYSSAESKLRPVF